MLNNIAFVPTSAESSYRVLFYDRPRKESRSLSWLAKVGPNVTIHLPREASLADFECAIDVTIDEPYDGKADDKSWDHSHGFLRWARGCGHEYMVTVFVSAETFASLTDLAARGNLPSLTIHCIAGCGLENEGPYGPMKWDTSREEPVPVKHVEFRYSFPKLG
jgi:hypothetical protein